MAALLLLLRLSRGAPWRAEVAARRRGGGKLRRRAEAAGRHGGGRGGKKTGRHAEATTALSSFSSAYRVGLHGARRRWEGAEAVEAARSRGGARSRWEGMEAVATR
ncbi:hypothetical protein GUJ93_ZPchr0002g24137 [Zizania palustris]|uniref:Uncharacterized protein n=1 Tax=Zizania palustris TaxID=103762 RepID=A0A8J5RS69_ZIZPA|nr:hypothetical protein GUJ93_ZPchr0002g24137 [Zizania palustris]